MDTLELGTRLKEMYETKGANKAAMIHLFGILYADEIRLSNIRPEDVVKAAGLNDSYKSEVRKGINLATYVDLKEKYKNKF